MQFSPQLKINLKSVTIITISWTIVGMFLTLYNNALLSTPYLSIGQSPMYNFKVQFMLWLFISASGGLIAGSFLVYINSKVFRKKSFRYGLITTAYSFTLLFVVLMFVYLTVRANVSLGENATLKSTLLLASKMLMNFIPIAHYFLWGSITLFTLFMLQMNDKFGPGILKKFLMGEYYQPKKEDRIFMFLDMKSSTTIAEQLGNEKYFNLLQDAFSHLTDPILDCEGEIYQYVGDEIVTSWPIKNGVRNANCLNCFFRIKEKLLTLEGYYKNKYGIAPSFKAGLHYGEVMAGEIGIIKKDIIYSGDVLNTAARIQAECNHYDADLLISGVTFKLLSKENQQKFKCNELGKIELRGRQEPVSIISISVI